MKGGSRARERYLGRAITILAAASHAVPRSRRKRPKRSTTKPRLMIETLVRILARNVLSLARCSVPRLSGWTVAGGPVPFRHAPTPPFVTIVR